MEIDALEVTVGGERRIQLAAKLSSTDAMMFLAVGDSLVDFGGIFGEGEDAFTLPTNQLRVPSAFPFAITFSPAFYTNPVLAGSTWLSEMLTRITAAVQAARAAYATEGSVHTVTTII